METSEKQPKAFGRQSLEPDETQSNYFPTEAPIMSLPFFQPQMTWSGVTAEHKLIFIRPASVVEQWTPVKTTSRC